MNVDYTCCICKGTFRSDWSDEDCRKEFREQFKREPTEEEIASPICEDCREKVVAHMRTRMN